MKRRALPAILLLLAPSLLAADPAKTSRLQGSTYLARNRPLVGSTIQVSSAGDAATMYVTTTDGRGQFEVGGLADGTYRVEASREGYETMVKTDIALRSPFRPVVEMLMRPGAAGDTSTGASQSESPVALSGSVTERGAGPVADATIHLASEDGSEDPRKIVSVAGGAFEVADLPAGSWRLTARAVGYLSLHTHLDIDRNTRLELIFVRQPADYEPSPLDLMPAEEPLPPAGYGPDGRKLADGKAAEPPRPPSAE